MTHPRVISDAVRKPDDRRKRARESKRQRTEEAEAREREEVKRLKNLKKREIDERCCCRVWGTGAWGCICVLWCGGGAADPLGAQAQHCRPPAWIGPGHMYMWVLGALPYQALRACSAPQTKFKHENPRRQCVS